MLTHQHVWAAVDALAERYGLTASGLARKAGLCLLYTSDAADE